MIEHLFSGEIMPLKTWLLFVALWIGLVAFPGPNVAFAISCGSRRGDIAAIAAAIGFASGVVVYSILIGLGLIAFLAASTVLFEVMRWIGVVYLGYLAWKSWHAPQNPVQPPKIEAREASGIVLRAALITLTNPKSAISYILVFPPFMTAGDGTADNILQLVILASTSVVISLAIYATYGLLAGRFGRLIKTKRQAMLRNRTFAFLFAGAGMALAWTARR